ncbi:STAS domain-containing protein [Leptospira idonii]|uniref:Anti-sigma factor antagonist n=1 Tax=Leptospira idonii TaxID=1193500 RepID=A0A4R9LVZ5_9LEPT|nr:STAS domain-containing protein [Leptospira idonii]TGN18443.1 anti-sigma factor antagonist [Leptospira idonii]
MNESNVSVHSEFVGDKLVIHVQGNLDVHNTHKVEQNLMGMVKTATHSIVYNLSEVNFISSAGLRMLVTSLRLCQEMKVSISICGLQPAVEKVFEIIGMQELFTIYPDLNAALS